MLRCRDARGGGAVRGVRIAVLGVRIRTPDVARTDGPRAYGMRLGIRLSGPGPSAWQETN
ncbi:hypothetical protein GCM10022233_71940 [Streptomyces shaanxiensis]|uniref:Uncharacterized protein n=1 Tax=Streptomyces shaanxiensis TaxID=653357 RepID=A0ABP7W4R0_9ACTN